MRRGEGVLEGVLGVSILFCSGGFSVGKIFGSSVLFSFHSFSLADFKSTPTLYTYRFRLSLSTGQDKCH